MKLPKIFIVLCDPPDLIFDTLYLDSVLSQAEVSWNWLLGKVLELTQNHNVNVSNLLEIHEELEGHYIKDKLEQDLTLLTTSLATCLNYIQLDKHRILAVTKLGQSLALEYVLKGE